MAAHYRMVRRQVKSRERPNGPDSRGTRARYELRMSELPRMYNELADWWYLISAPEDYAEEAATFIRVLREHCRVPPRTMLELGSGGGNNAFHMKRAFEATLVDVSEEMLSQSRRMNPECVHVHGDMRTVRLGREFDCVFVHDAIDYMTTIEDLRLAMTTAFVHCKPGGAALLTPDHTLETARPETLAGGHDGEDRALRFLEWSWDPDPLDSQYFADYVYLLRHPDGSLGAEMDRHVLGLYSTNDWLETMRTVGFEARMVEFEHSELDYRPRHFVGVRP